MGYACDPAGMLPAIFLVAPLDLCQLWASHHVGSERRNSEELEHIEIVIIRFDGVSDSRLDARVRGEVVEGVFRRRVVEILEQVGATDLGNLEKYNAVNAPWAHAAGIGWNASYIDGEIAARGDVPVCGAQAVVDVDALLGGFS